MKRTADGQRRTIAAVQASPATTSVCNVGAPPASTNPGTTLGGSVTWVIARSFNTAANASPASMRARPGRQRQAPRHQAVKTSDTEASKLSEANCSNRLRGSMANASICASVSSRKPSCSTSTPLGVPVEPEV